jgi:hypothetical protein
MVIVLHSPYSSDLAPCDFALFSKLKMKLTGRRFERVSAIQKESQAVLDSIKENDFHSAFEVYMLQRRLFGRRWQPELSKLSQHFFFYLVWELSNTPHIRTLMIYMNYSKSLKTVLTIVSYIDKTTKVKKYKTIGWSYICIQLPMHIFYHNHNFLVSMHFFP